MKTPGEESPYGAFATTPDLKAGHDFVDDYALAFKLSSTIQIPDLDAAVQIIRDEVSEALGSNVDTARILAVSALTANARLRSLHREEWRNTKGLNAVTRSRLRLWPPFSPKRIRRENELLHSRARIYSSQRALHEANTSYLSEALDTAPKNSQMLDTE